MNANLLEKLTAAQLKTNIPDFRAGDTVAVSTKIKEGEKERVQLFEGVVIRRRGRGVQESFTVRKISYGVGVERVFPIHSPTIEKIEVVSKGKVRRAYLSYLRGLAGKAARIKSEERWEVVAKELTDAPEATHPPAKE